MGLNTINNGLNSSGALANVVCVTDRGREGSIKSRSYPTSGCCAMEGKEGTASNIEYILKSVIRLMHREPSIFRRLHVVAKGACYLCRVRPSVSLSVSSRNSAVPIRRI